jgi:hypothetical protein
MTTCFVSRMICLVTVLAVFARPAGVRADENAAAPTNQHFAVELIDSSLIVCTPQLDVIPIRTSFADIKIPLLRIESMKIDHDAKTVALTFLNGDRLQGECLLESITVRSLLGELKIPLRYMTALRSSIKKAPVFEDSPAKKSVCTNNLRQIDAGKEQWAMATSKSHGDAVDIRGVNEYIKGNRTPICPAGGSYDYTTIGTDPACNVPGHSFR